MSHDKEIENLLIVDDSNYSKQTAADFAKRIVKFGKITKKGDIIILDNSLSQDNKLRLSLALRFIAHTFDENIPETIMLKELANILSERVESVGSRMSKAMKNDNFAKKVKKGVYQIQYFVMDKFITNLENSEEAIVSGGRQRTAKKGGKRKNKALTGVGKDILELLINNDFFKTPKTIKEVCEKLKEETKFYDPKVVDMTIRKTLIDSKKILKRIPNPEKGRAKWIYINR